MKRPNRHRTLRSISASVGEESRQRIAIAAREAAPGSAQKGHPDKSWATGPAASTQVGPGAQACDDPNLGHNCPRAVGFPIRICRFHRERSSSWTQTGRLARVTM
jgi:hypothetical protein